MSITISSLSPYIYLTQFPPVKISVLLVYFGFLDFSTFFFKPGPFCFSASIFPVTFPSACEDCVFLNLLREHNVFWFNHLFFFFLIIPPSF